ncbi:MAG: hypothetical protein J6K92_01955 [Oscillospiraceae bacterium]|nr:hypothetical protein [Oscillospiraceae bacterium]
MKQSKIIGLCAAVCILTGGCAVDSSIDSLLSPPMISEEQQEIYSALIEAAGEDISLVYPRSGAYRSAFVFPDLDMDGEKEAVVFYGSLNGKDSSVRVNILDKIDGKWRSVYDHAGGGTTVEQVFFTDLGGTGRLRMAIGYGYMTPTEKTLKIYCLDDGVLETEYTGSYYKTLTLDLDNNGGQDIVMVNCNNENHFASLSLVTDRGEGAECVSTVDMDPATVDIPSVIGGYIGNGTPAVFADGLLGSGNLSTEIIYCVNGELRNPARIDGSELPVRTVRPTGLYSRDIDGDGIIEIPEREAFPGYKDRQDAQYITNWNVFENYSMVKKYSSLTDPYSGYAFMIPVRWEGRVTVKNDGTTGEKVFYKYNGSLAESRLELMRIMVCSKEDSEKYLLLGYTAVAGTDNAVYMVRFGDTEDNLLLTTAEVSNNFYLY